MLMEDYLLTLAKIRDGLGFIPGLANITSTFSRREMSGISKLVDAIFRKTYEMGYGFLISEDVISVSRTRNSSLFKIFVWTGTTYLSAEKEEIKNFLADAAIKFGIPEDEARSFKFKDNLFKQFVSTDVSIYSMVDKTTRLKELRIAFLNALVKVSRSGAIEVSKPERDVIPTVILPVEYDADATSPLFDKCMSHAFAEGTVETFYEFIGECLIPFVHAYHMNLQKCSVLVGPPDTGKSVIKSVVQAFFGEENTIERQLSTLTDPDSKYVKDLEGKRICLANESNCTIKDQARFCGLISGEGGEAAVKFSDACTLKDYAKILIIGNEYPRIAKPEEQYYKRLLIFPANHRVGKEQQDSKLAKRIISDEMSGVANHFIKGLCTLLERERYELSEEMKIELGICKFKCRQLAEFISVSGYVATPGKGTTSRARMHEEFKEFCAAHRYSSLSSQEMAEALRSAGFTEKIIDHSNYFEATKDPEHEDGKVI